MKHPKLSRPAFYPVGLLSLLLLPLLGINYFIWKGVFKKTVMMDVVWLNADNVSENAFTSFSSFRKYRKFEDFVFTGNRASDRMFLEQFEDQLEKIVQEKDTMNGVHIHFGDHAKYNEIVEAINVCKKQNASFVLYEGEIFALYNEYPAIKNGLYEPQIFGCGTSSLLEKKANEPVQAAGIFSMQNSWIMLGLFVAMVLLNMKKIYQRFHSL